MSEMQNDLENVGLEGVNVVELQGFLKYKQIKETSNNNFLFSGKVAVPATYFDKQTKSNKSTFKYVKISAWGDVAQGLFALDENTPVHVYGSFNERNYDGNCKLCGGQEKKYWTDVLVDNFTVVGG